MKKEINNYLIPFLVVLNIVIIVQFQTLPNRITKAINPNSCKKDTIIKVVSDNLPKKQNFVYFEGKMLKNFKIDDNYQYSPKYPQEFWDGYLILCESIKGGKYYIWSKNKSEMCDIKGWFITIDGNWQDDKDYLSCLIPVVEKYNKNEFN